MESVRSARKLFLADWSRSELSSEEILEENMLEISLSVVRPSIMLQPGTLRALWVRILGKQACAA